MADQNADKTVAPPLSKSDREVQVSLQETPDKKIERLRNENEALKLEVENAKLRMSLRATLRQLDNEPA